MSLWNILSVVPWKLATPAVAHYSGGMRPFLRVYCIIFLAKTKDNSLDLVKVRFKEAYYAELVNVDVPELLLQEAGQDMSPSVQRHARFQRQVDLRNVESSHPFGCRRRHVVRKVTS